VAEVPVAKIGPDPDQPREEFDEDAIDRLADSLRDRGQLQPIRVRWDESRAQYMIVFGERRWRAAQKAGLETMLAIIVEGEVGPGELLAIQMIENCVREDLQPIEQAKAFRQLMNLNGWSARQVARELGIVQSNVVRSLALLELPTAIQDQVEQGALPPATAYEVSKVENPVAQEEIAHRVVAEKLSRAETVEAVRQASKPSRAGGARRVAGQNKEPAERSLKTAGGHQVIVVAKGNKGLSVQDWVEALEEAVRVVRSKLDQAAA
jgi:ParB family chromosome partitioning protein